MQALLAAGDTPDQVNTQRFDSHCSWQCPERSPGVRAGAPGSWRHFRPGEHAKPLFPLLMAMPSTAARSAYRRYWRSWSRPGQVLTQNFQLLMAKPRMATWSACRFLAAGAYERVGDVFNEHNCCMTRPVRIPRLVLS